MDENGLRTSLACDFDIEWLTSAQVRRAETFSHAASHCQPISVACKPGTISKGRTSWVKGLLAPHALPKGIKEQHSIAMKYLIKAEYINLVR
jgi:hypothetical protein